MTNELEKKVSSGITNAIESRIQHPFIGTLIFSFFVKNFDILYALAISSKMDTVGISAFMNSFSSEPNRVWIPIAFAFGVALFADTLLFNIRRIIDSIVSNLTNRVIEQTKKISLENKILTLETNLGKISDDNQKLRLFIQSFIPSLIQKLNTINPELFLTFAPTNLEKGDLVGFDGQKGYLKTLNKSQGMDFCGIIQEKISENIYLVLNRFDLSYLPKELIAQSNREFRNLNWDPKNKDLKFSKTANASDVHVGFMDGTNFHLSLKFEGLDKSHLEGFSNLLLQNVLDGNFDYVNDLIKGSKFKS